MSAPASPCGRAHPYAAGADFTQLDSIEISEDILQLALRGRLDIAGTQLVEQKFAFATTTRPVSVIVDLSQVSFLASIGIRMLLTAARAQEARGGRVVLAAPQPTVFRVLQAAGIDQILSVVDDVDTARASFGA